MNIPQAIVNILKQTRTLKSSSVTNSIIFDSWRSKRLWEQIFWRVERQQCLNVQEKRDPLSLSEFGSRASLVVCWSSVSWRLSHKFGRRQKHVDGKAAGEMFSASHNAYQVPAWFSSICCFCIRVSDTFSTILRLHVVLDLAASGVLSWS